MAEMNKRVLFSLQKTTLKEFKEKCDERNLKYSPVIDFLIREWLDSLKHEKKGK